MLQELAYLAALCTIQAVIAWLESITWLDSSHDFWGLGLDLSHVEKNGDSTRVTFFTEWLDSNNSQWLESRVRVIFTKLLSSWWTNPVRLHTKKWSLFASVMIKIGGNFTFCLPSSVEQIGDFCNPNPVYLYTLSWFISWSWQWAAYCDLESFPDIKVI